jgi:hypothetical protein
MYQLSTTAEWKEVFNEIKARKDKTNKLGTFSSYVNQTIERLVMDSFVPEELLAVSPDRFDGKLVPKEFNLDLEECTQRVSNRTGYDIKFVCSELVSNEPRPVLWTSTDSKVVLFDVEGTLLLYKGSSIKFRPGIERIQELQAHGYLIGLYSNKGADHLDWHHIEAALRVQFAFVFTGEVCYKPSPKYVRDNPDLNEYDELKPLAPFFKDLNQVLLVDDTLGKIHHSERHRAVRIPTWDGLDTNRDLHRIVDELLGNFADRTHPFELRESPLAKWLPGTTVLEYGPEVDKVLPIQFTTQCQVKAAGMGLGKTYQAIAAANAVEKECQDTLGLPARILLVSCRRTLANYFKSVFANVVHYTDSNWKGADVLTFQIESFHKLVGVEAFDLMVIDEIRGVVGSLTSIKTNKHHLGTNFEVFKLLAQTTPRVLVLDADVEADGAAMHLLNMIFKPEQITFHRYLHVSLPSTLQFMTNENDFVELIKETLSLPTLIKKEDGSLRDGLRTVAVACNSRNDALKLAEAFKLLLDPALIKVITSMTDDKDIKRVGSDMNSVVAAHRLFIFTSTITQGVDCTEPVDNIFIMARRMGGACARDLLQMMGRFRKKMIWIIYCLVSAAAADSKPRAYQHALFRLASGKSAVEKNINILKLRDVQLLDKHIRYAPTAICQLFAFSDAERSRNLKFELVRLAQRKGYQVNTEMPVKGKLSKDLVKAKGDVKQNDLEFRREMFANMVDFDKQALLGRVEFAGAMISNQTASREDRVALTVAAIKLHFIDFNGFSRLTFDDFELVLKYRQEIKNLAMAQRAETRAIGKPLLARLDSQSVARSPYADLGFVTTFTLLVEGFQKCCNLLGLEWVLDTKTVFDEAKMETPEFKAAVAEIPIAVRSRASHTKGVFNLKLKAAFAIKLEGHRVGFHTEGAERLYQLKTNPDVLRLALDSDYFTAPDLKDIKEFDVVEVKVRESRKRKAEAEAKAPVAKKARFVGRGPLVGASCGCRMSMTPQQHFNSAECKRNNICQQLFAFHNLS